MSINITFQDLLNDLIKHQNKAVSIEKHILIKNKDQRIVFPEIPDMKTFEIFLAGLTLTTPTSISRKTQYNKIAQSASNVMSVLSQYNPTDFNHNISTQFNIDTKVIGTQLTQHYAQLVTDIQSGKLQPTMRLVILQEYNEKQVMTKTTGMLLFGVDNVIIGNSNKKYFVDLLKFDLQNNHQAFLRKMTGSFNKAIFKKINKEPSAAAADSYIGFSIANQLCQQAEQNNKENTIDNKLMYIQNLLHDLVQQKPTNLFAWLNSVEAGNLPLLNDKALTMMYNFGDRQKGLHTKAPFIATNGNEWCENLKQQVDRLFNGERAVLCVKRCEILEREVDGLEYQFHNDIHFDMILNGVELVKKSARLGEQFYATCQEHPLWHEFVNQLQFEAVPLKMVVSILINKDNQVITHITVQDRPDGYTFKTLFGLSTERITLSFLRECLHPMLHADNLAQNDFIQWRKMWLEIICHHATSTMAYKNLFDFKHFAISVFAECGAQDNLFADFKVNLDGTLLDWTLVSNQLSHLYNSDKRCVKQVLFAVSDDGSNIVMTPKKLHKDETTLVKMINMLA